MTDLLTVAESDELARYEAKVEQGLASFMETGTALLHIRDKRLHRATHSTFEDYLRERWNISRPRGYELMNAAATAAAVSAMADTPAIESERVARAIAPVVKEHGPERAAEVLREVAASGPVTAAAITQATRPATVTTRTEVTEVVDLATGESVVLVSHDGKEIGKATRVGRSRRLPDGSWAMDQALFSEMTWDEVAAWAGLILSQIEGLKPNLTMVNRVLELRVAVPDSIGPGDAATALGTTVAGWIEAAS